MEKNKELIVLQEKIRKIEQQTSFYLKEIKNLLSSNPTGNELNIISYFTYTTNLSHDKDLEHMMIGTYHIHNLGKKTITNPYICLKLSSNSPFQFSGKYINKNSNLSMKLNDAWERLNNQSDKEEYWLKPLGEESLAPSQIISFPNFQVKWHSNKPYSGSITGFTYFDEKKEGIPSINQISVSGN
ncbi:hypothetical protein [Bacillus sp. J37]|uniref:hypothetical protein n=1 Tax=Bacillus sp. J37 TaxID=935837 RepID=UPI00047D6732|nr:hypothetical protein [Bacillus sp. J37]